jgi:anti-sigma B factor antagonist
MLQESRDAHVDAADMLWIDRRVDNHSVIVRAVGEVDLVTAPLLSTQLAMAVAVVVPPAPVVLDLEGMSFLSAQGLKVLLRHHQRCVDLGSRLEIFGGRVVRRVVAAAGVDQVLLIRSPAPST